MRTTSILLAVVAAAGLAGCGTVSHGVANDGRSAGALVFPDPATATLPGGTFVNLDNLRQVAPGMSRDQLYDLLGRPHFHEGAFGVREWDYIFDFRTGDGDGFASCQYKVLFDRNKLAQSFYWKPAACAERLHPAKPAAPAQPTVAPPIEPQSLNLSADTLFAFDSAQLSDAGQHRLDRLAERLHAVGTLRAVSILGFTDRLGSSAYNQMLSQRRAEAVRDFLVAHGVPATAISAEGRGESDPHVQCDDRQRTALITCLAPNRRVEITVDAQP